MNEPYLWRELCTDEVRNEDMRFKNFLFDNYNIVFSENHNAWMRIGKTNIETKNKFELGNITKIITGENILFKGTSFIDEQENGIDGNYCICGCNKCSSLFKLYHKKTKNCFLVGSSCIEKAGHDDFVKNMNCATRNGRCRLCNIPLKINGKFKNYKKSYNLVCMRCRVEKKIYLRIHYNEKDHFKEYFKTKWDADLKYWYWKGYEDKIPEILKERILNI
uniref:Uncharacterized protein n=1 Tax=viral metagenome TaxID=1070528 RepID=A0A6C0CID8_9ZZZZ